MPAPEHAHLRIFATAIARRIAYVVVAAALAWFGFDSARAQTYDYSNCTNNMAAEAVCPTVAQAQAALTALAQSKFSGKPGERIISGPTTTRHSDTHYAVSISYYYIYGAGGYYGSANRTVRIAPCPAGQVYNPVYAGQGNGRCQSPCDGRASETFSPISGAMIPNGSVGCTGGCATMITSNGDGSYQRSFIGGGSAGFCDVLPNDCSVNGPGYTMNYGLGVCQPPVDECAANEIKDPLTGMCTNGCPSGMHTDANGVCVADKEDCPPGNVRSPAGVCLPGEGQCAAGEARRENGTCGRDSDGDGQADEDDDDPDNDPEKESFSGGDTCTSPPSCSGGAIECGQARIQWRIDCNTRRTVNITGGSCSAMPVCVGDNCKAMEYAQLLQQWRAACALEKLAGGEGGEGGDNQDLIDLLTDPGSIQPDLGGTDGMSGGGGGYDWGDGDGEEFEPDTGGMGWGSSCPSPPAIAVFGQTLNFNLAPMCNWLALAGNLVVILASLLSLRIVSGGTA